MNIDAFSPLTLEAIQAHAAKDFPNEACGLIIVRKGRERYVACKNIANSGDHFVMSREDFSKAEDEGEILAIVHSHPNVAARPSEADLVGCEATNVPWLIISWPTGLMSLTVPTGYKAPLIGRSYAHGILDCYSLCRDYYKETLGLDLPDYERDDFWWLKGQDMYLDNFQAAGFSRVPNKDLKLHDGILMQVSSKVPNHAAIYIGDGLILHHVQGRLSSRDVYGGYWQKNTYCVVRHESQKC